MALASVEDLVVVVGHSVGSAEAALVAAKCDPALLVYLCPRFGSFETPADAPAIFRDGFPFPPKDAGGRMVWGAGCGDRSDVSPAFRESRASAGKASATRSLRRRGLSARRTSRRRDGAHLRERRRVLHAGMGTIRRARVARDRADRDSRRPLPDDRRPRRAGRAVRPPRPFNGNVDGRVEEYPNQHYAGPVTVEKLRWATHEGGRVLRRSAAQPS